MNVVWLVIGGSLGTISRYYLAQRIADASGVRTLGVFAVNVAGAFAIGLFLTLAQERFDWPDGLRVLVAAGFLGGFTTFSALAWDARHLAELRDLPAAAAYLAGTIVCGMLAVYAGAALGARFG